MTTLPEAGDQIASYRIERRLGEGGMAVVYLAEDVVLDRHVALKLIQPRMADEVRFRDRFLRESRLAARLEHPHIVPVYSAGEERGLYYIAMRYINGGDLETLLESPGHRSTPMDTDLALSILAPVADALDTAHAQGLVHRDVKPANILLERRGGDYEVFLSDFGIAKALEGTRYTVDGDVLGTPSYIAPEQARGEVVDGRSDVYALACVAFRCLTGAPPFVRDNPLAVMAAHSTEPAPALSEFRPALSSLDEVFERGLAKEGRDRPASCATLITALRQALETSRPVRQRTETVDVPALVGRIEEQEGRSALESDRRTRPQPGGGSPTEGPHERSGWTSLAWYLVGLIGIVVVAFFVGRLLLSTDDEPAPVGVGPDEQFDADEMEDLVPTGVFVEREADGIRVSWTDNSDGRFGHFVLFAAAGTSPTALDGLEPVVPGVTSVLIPGDRLVEVVEDPSAGVCAAVLVNSGEDVGVDLGSEDVCVGAAGP